MSSLTTWLRARLSGLGYVAHRWPTTRFDGMADALQLLKVRGYSPRVVIDCGANVGQWTTLASSIFDNSEWHLVEPQPACVRELRQIVSANPRVTVHPVALTRGGTTSVRMIGGGHNGQGTGNFVAMPGESDADAQVFPASTLDDLFSKSLQVTDRAFLKLDLETHELEALHGALRMLPLTEVVLSEVSIFDITGSRPTFGDIFAFLREHGFEFYDVACLSSRPRDKRLRQADVIFVRRDSQLLTDHAWA